MDRFDPFVKYADVYGDIINWEKDPMNRPQNQNKYFFSDGKTYYEQLLRIMRLVSVFKDAFNQIYNNEDEISTAWENFVNNLSATAVPGEDPSVELVWTDDSVQFNFTMPQGLPGPAGPQGVSISSITFNQDYSMTITLSNGQTYTSSSLRGPEGPEGSGLEILDVYPTLADLQTAHPTGSPGDAYQVGSGSSFILYIWSASQNAWVNAGTLSSPSPSSALPSMNGTASAGSSMLYSRGDHVHPSDTNKLDKSTTNGVYAVENGSQTMLSATVNPQQGALVKWDTNGTLNANAVDTDTARVQGNISADTGTFQTSITTGNITASGDISADTIEVADNLILNSTKLEGVAGSTNAYQILTTLGADRDVLGMGADTTDNTPTVKFMAGKWANNGTMGDATSEVKFTDSFAPDYNYDPTGGRIGLAPASATVLGGVKPGTGIAVDSNGILSNKFDSLASGTDLNDIRYNYHGYVSTPLNGPSNYTSGMISVIANETGNNVMQLHHYYNGDRIYVRYYREATGWHDWYAIMQRPLQALWVNESSASAFAPQTISLDLTGFVYVVIVFRQLTTNTIHEASIATPNGYDFLAHSVLTTGTILYKRTFTARTNGVQFYVGRKESNTEDNTVMIPRYIYGIR